MNLNKFQKQDVLKTTKVCRGKIIDCSFKIKTNIAELRKSKDNNAEIEETKKNFNELRNNFSKREIKKIRIKFSFRESIDKYLKELEQKDSLTE